MQHRTDKQFEKLTAEEKKPLVDFFHLLIKCDERNKREGRYDKMKNQPQQ